MQHILHPRLQNHLDTTKKSLDPEGLSSNPNAINHLKQNIDKIHYGMLSANPNAFHLLEKKYNEKVSKRASKGESCYKGRICWRNLSKNPSAVLLLLNPENDEKVDWNTFSLNPSVEAVSYLSLKENNEKINWENLSKNPEAIKLLEKNPDEIIWKNLSENPNAIHLLKQNLKKIDLVMLSKNENIFLDDTKEYKIKLKLVELLNEKFV